MERDREREGIRFPPLEYSLTWNRTRCDDEINFNVQNSTRYWILSTYISDRLVLFIAEYET